MDCKLKMQFMLTVFVVCSCLPFLIYIFWKHFHKHTLLSQINLTIKSSHWKHGISNLSAEICIPVKSLTMKQNTQSSFKRHTFYRLVMAFIFSNFLFNLYSKTFHFHGSEKSKLYVMVQISLNIHMSSSVKPQIHLWIRKKHLLSFHSCSEA